MLSPARMDGVRAGFLLKPTATFDLAVRLRQGGVTLAEAFAFASGLYFRGKIAYARRFAVRSADAVRVITANSGLVDPERRVTPEDLRRFGSVPIHPENERYLSPLRRHAQQWRKRMAKDGVVVLLGSIATAKYRDVLLEVYGDRLSFPAEFVGRGDMSRGALLLHAAREGRELEYRAVQGAVLTGRRAAGWRQAAEQLKQRGLCGNPPG